MHRSVPLDEEQAHLSDLVTEVADRDVYLLRHGEPVGVLTSPTAHERLIDRIEDLEDALSVHEAGDAVPFEEGTSPPAD